VKRWIGAGFMIVAGIAAIVRAEKQGVKTRASSDAVLQMSGDAQQALTRVPLSMTRISDEDEIRLGDELAREYSVQFQGSGSWDSVALQSEALVNEIGARVASHAQRHLPYKFHYIPNPHFMNACALPGGHVFIGRGLIQRMASEDALAAVLGHEVEHADLRHCVDRAQTEANLRHLGVLGDVLSLPVEVFAAGYSKTQEFEADRHGMQLAVDEGYSPQGILQLLAVLESEERSQGARSETPPDEIARVTVETMNDYFRTHPPPAERIGQIESLARSQRWPQPPLRSLPTGVGASH
jgi:predicted Zn-dependent protease